MEEKQTELFDWFWYMGLYLYFQKPSMDMVKLTCLTVDLNGALFLVVSLRCWLDLAQATFKVHDTTPTEPRPRLSDDSGSLLNLILSKTRTCIWFILCLAEGPG